MAALCNTDDLRKQPQGSQGEAKSQQRALPRFVRCAEPHHGVELFATFSVSVLPGDKRHDRVWSSYLPHVNKADAKPSLTEGSGLSLAACIVCYGNTPLGHRGQLRGLRRSGAVHGCLPDLDTVPNRMIYRRPHDPRYAVEGVFELPPGNPTRTLRQATAGAYTFSKNVSSSCKNLSKSQNMV